MSEAQQSVGAPPLIPPVTPPVPLPPPRQEFWLWAVSTFYSLRTALGIGAIIAAALTVKSFFPSLLPSAWIGESISSLDRTAKSIGNANLPAVQALACFLLALFTPRPSMTRLGKKIGRETSQYRIAEKACENIQLTVVCLFASWCLYYTVTAIAHASTTVYKQAAMTSLDSVTTVILFWLYLELAKITVPEPSPAESVGGRLENISVSEPPDKPAAAQTSTRMSEEHRAAHSARVRNNSQAVIFARVIFICAVAAVLVPMWYAVGATNLDKANTESICLVFEVISSCLAGVALALVVGRLGSPLIDPGSLTIAFLYLYAVIQPSSALFANHPFVQLLATTIAFPLKVLLWLVCVWAFTTGTLADYVYEIRVLIEEAKSHPYQTLDVHTF